MRCNRKIDKKKFMKTDDPKGLHGNVLNYVKASTVTAKAFGFISTIAI